MSIFLLILLSFFKSIDSQYYCADEIQKCTLQAEEYESVVQNLKEEAFVKCFKRPTCHEEKRLFDRCYKTAVRSLRSPLKNAVKESQEMFSVSLTNFRSSSDRCFLNSPFVPRRRNFGPMLLEEDVVYARLLVSGEISDRLWGLPELGRTRPSLDTLAVCRTKELPRVFGNGISRLLHTGDPKINNLTSSCLLEESELLCYRQHLDNNVEYLQAIYQRDYMLRSCLANVRAQTPCKNHDQSRLRSCICGARDTLDKNLQMDLLDCVRRFSVHNIEDENPTKEFSTDSIHDSDTGSINIDEIKPPKTPEKKPMLPFSSSLTRGDIINGQCLCSCGAESRNQQSTKEVVGVTSSIEVDRTPETLVRFKSNSPHLIQPSAAHGLLIWKKKEIFA